MHCPGRAVHLNHIPGPGRSVSQVCRESIVSGVPCVSSGELISGCNPPGNVNHPGSQEDMVSNWEPAHSLVEDAISGAEIAPCLPALVVACLPLFLWWGDGPVCSPLSPFWCLLSRLLSKWARLPLGLSFFGESSLSHSFSLSLAIPQFGLLSHVSSLRLSAEHSGPVLALNIQPAPPCSAPARCWLMEHLGYFSTESCG